MRVRPLFSDSLGVRSLSVMVETDIRIVIDPSAALGPRRYGLPPAPQEWEALARAKEEIASVARSADVLVISHYHYDHYDPGEDFYEGKKVFAKHPERDINRSQRGRARPFWEKWQGRAELVAADGEEFRIGETTLRFSEPFPHGERGTRLGYVIMTVVEHGGRKFIHASDVEGPVVEEAKEFILEERPWMVVVDGPPTYFLGYRFSAGALEASRRNLEEIAEKVEVLILDHHLLRDLSYRERLSSVFSRGNVRTFAEELGLEPNLLEARRRELHASSLNRNPK